MECPTTRKKFVVTTPTRTCSGELSRPGSTCRAVRNAAKSSKLAFDPSRISTKFSFDSGIAKLFRLRRSMYMTTSRSGSLYGSGRSSTALVTLKIVVLAPIPNAIVSAAAIVNTGLRARVRNANDRSIGIMSGLIVVGRPCHAEA
jgi:hypothetical protein